MNDADATLAVRQWREAGPDLVVLDGFHALKHALRFGADVRSAVTSDKDSALALAAELADDVTDAIRESVVEVPAEVLRALVPRVHATRMAALAVRRGRRTNLDALSAQPRQSPVVVLDNPRNLGNVGAVVRLAAGFGATGVITTGDMDPWHANAVRSGAGLHFATAVERLSPEEFPPGPLYALDPEGDDIRSVDIPDDALLAFGSERHGLSAEIRSRATKLLSLPMRPQVSSYNLATSVAMTLFHWGGPAGTPSGPAEAGSSARSADIPAPPAL
ncbi:TrmH family RNA methyltransferase [Streptomyces sp. NPDC126933]|uniref:TrmH family RNA methyltransferase n=1 Tax=unclassified Streptomyces TaxID=2593676 RepID=UPI00364DED65